jgi:DedD protein
VTARAATRGGGARRVGTLLVLVGLVGVLGGTFALGFVSGRHWPRVQVMLGLAKPRPQLAGEAVPAPAETAPRGAGRRSAAVPTPPPGESRPASADAPRLTFYEELTAPLASMPPAGAAAAKPVASTPASETTGRGMRREADAASVERETQRTAGARATEGREASAGAGAARAPAARVPAGAAAADERFAVQVAAYTTSARAEALRARLAGLGFAAAISETRTPSGPRWRVRIGSYASRDRARAEADRVTAETRLDAIVVRHGGDAAR